MSNEVLGGDLSAMFPAYQHVATIQPVRLTGTAGQRSMPSLPPQEERLPIRCWPPTRERRHHAQDRTSDRHRCLDGGSRRRPLHEPPKKNEKK